jgi:AbrB family looped-hinge helix DNA binding protein
MSNARLATHAVLFYSKTMLKAKVSARGQIALPKVVRDQLGLTDGVSVVVSVEGEKIILRKAPEGSWRQWDSRLKGSDLLADLRAERRRELVDDSNRP